MLARDVRIIAVVALLVLSAAAFHDGFRAAVCPTAGTGEHLTLCDDDLTPGWQDVSSDTSEGQEAWRCDPLAPLSHSASTATGRPRPGNRHAIDHPPAA